MPVKNLIGQKFGKLTVIGLSKQRNEKNNKILWECKCDCGKPEIILATTGNLTQGYKTSCGCRKKEHWDKIKNNQIKDLTNQKFGKLIALALIPGSSPPEWKCICECGNEVIVKARDLYQNNIVSCGCKRKDLRNSLIGQRFGKLEVIERAENYVSPKGATQVRYLCKCDCGGYKIVNSSSLKRGVTTSCGCVRSIGEVKVAKFLTELNVSYKQELRLEECKDVRPLPFDFGIFNKTGQLLFLIEINGQQHYEPKFGNSKTESEKILQYTQSHDKIKQEFCQSNNIDLLIIPYWELNNYKKIITERLKQYNEL